ncbi:MAG: putative heme-binding domain-containing protein, partial [Candidatus Paceibacteria bacterium]
VLRKIRALESTTVDERLAQTWGVFRETAEDKRAKIEEFQANHADLPWVSARPAHGREVYDRTCGKCHKLFDEGGTLGPDLTGSNRFDLEYLGSNMIDPNAVIGRQYQITVVRTHGGQLLTGVLENESATSVTLVTETERSVVAKADIEERYVSDLSAMPEGQLDTLNPAELRDLVAYLHQTTQVPRLLELPETNALFNGVDLQGWTGDENVWHVAGGELVGKSSDGLATNAFLVSELELGDFRLSFDVLLADNAGNSGVQFRSRAADGGLVAGYQADIGQGWWGKLYEEHGRAVLSESAAESALLESAWNHYVIEARGHHIRTWLNGALSVDLEDTEGALSGCIALQVHSGGPTDVRFKNFVLAAPAE